MPPSGFREKFINGVLKSVGADYEATLKEFTSQNELSEYDFLEQRAAALEQRVEQAVAQGPLSTDETISIGWAECRASCYRDLAYEIKEGCDKHGRPVFDGKAIQKELDQIGVYLKEFKI